MAAVKNWSDDELVGLVWDWRITNGACTLGDLRKATGMAKSSLQTRVDTLVADGRLVKSATVGSLRGADELIMCELPDGRLISGKERMRGLAS